MTTKHEANRQAIQQLWNQGIQDAKEIHNRTNISLSTIYDNLKKLKHSGTIQRIEGSGRPKKNNSKCIKSIRPIHPPRFLHFYKGFINKVIFSYLIEP